MKINAKLCALPVVALLVCVPWCAAKDAVSKTSSASTQSLSKLVAITNKIRTMPVWKVDAVMQAAGKHDYEKNGATSFVSSNDTDKKLVRRVEIMHNPVEPNTEKQITSVQLELPTSVVILREDAEQKFGERATETLDEQGTVEDGKWCTLVRYPQDKRKRSLALLFDKGGTKQLRHIEIHQR